MSFDIQFWAAIVTAVGGVIAAFKAIDEMKKANAERTRTREQQERELRFRQAETSKRFLDETYGNRRIMDAFTIVDVTEYSFKVEHKSDPITVDHRDLARALSLKDLRPSADEWAIRERFDAMLNQFGRIDHYIRVGLLVDADIMAPLRYYAARCVEHEAALSPYGETYGGELGIQFLRRFPAYEAAYLRRAKAHEQRPSRGAAAWSDGA